MYFGEEFELIEAPEALVQSAGLGLLPYQGCLRSLELCPGKTC